MVIVQTRIWHCKTKTFFPWNKKTVAVTGHRFDLSETQQETSLDKANSSVCL